MKVLAGERDQGRVRLPPWKDGVRAMLWALLSYSHCSVPLRWGWGGSRVYHLLPLLCLACTELVLNACLVRDCMCLQSERPSEGVTRGRVREGE